jgi:hypothetical protein
MKLAVSAFLATFAVAPAALACPASMACGTSGLTSYGSALSLGILIGVASVGLERLFRRDR